MWEISSCQFLKRQFSLKFDKKILLSDIHVFEEKKLNA